MIKLDEIKGATSRSLLELTLRVVEELEAGSTTTFAASWAAAQKQALARAREQGRWKGQRHDAECFVEMHAAISAAANPAWTQDEALAWCVVHIMEYAAGKGLDIGAAVEAKINAR